MHLRFFHLGNLTVIGSAVFFLASCANPPVFKTWIKPNASEADAKQAMRDCGFPNAAGTTRETPRNEAVKMYQCMKQKGFQNSGFSDICDIAKEMPACVAQKQGYPVSVTQLEAMPFFEDDPGFWPILEKSNLTSYSLISWRPAGASQDYKLRPENYQATLPVMYACGYPNPLGSGEQVSIGVAARVQMCMQAKGFIPDRANVSLSIMIPVCRQYPELPDCKK
ncbi:hypothetical protein [Collimonas antrihumi]|uniref:hypothetical protein n=1 Tax=Collimonas antrihumi TaxID=1940615 RepID=UPI001B8D19CD|nr:hypothetical protein [Collimonas antrihumi]